MISLKNIAIIVRYETKILWRNWFFRIFALAIISILIFFNIGVFSPVSNNRWFQRAISAGIPYANMVFLNLVQVAVLVFLATGIIRNNKKLDTNEVFYVRPVSNADLVLGKAAALLKLFFWLNIVILTIALIINATSTDTNINLKAYVYYPLLISFPNIIFTTSLSFLLVGIIRNQAVSIILMLGLVAMILIYFQGKYYFLPDFVAFKLPLQFSDIAGFSNLPQLVLHRAIYLCLAITFFFATVLLFKRLPQKKVNRAAAALITTVFLAGSVWLVTLYLNGPLTDKALREEIITLNGEMAGLPNIDIKSCDLDVDHLGNTIHCQAKLTVQNNYTGQLKDLFLTLNPGLEVTKLLLDGEELAFKRKAHLILFKSTQRILSGEERSIEVHYRGTLKEAVCYLDMDWEWYKWPRQVFLYNIDRRFVFLGPEYVLLTKEALWYPGAEVGYNRKSLGGGQNNFIDFRLKVKTQDNLLPISQGLVTNSAPGSYEFTPEFSLPQISLVIGDYDKKGVTVDSTDFNLFVHKGNDYFSAYFDQVQDTLTALIRDLKNGYEQEQNIKYPFSRFQLIETPIHFHSFTTLYENHQAYIQPETILLPEKGGKIWELDFKRQFKSIARQAKRDNQILDDKDKQANVFKNFVKVVLTKQQTPSRFSWGDRNNAHVANYGIFPNLYWYQTGVDDEKWPLLNKNLADYLNQEATVDNDISRNWRGISFIEDCNNLMREKNLEDILSEEESFDKIIKIIELKGDYLLKYLEMRIGKDAFKSFLYDLINQYTYKIISYDDLRAAIQTKFGLDIDPVINQAYSQVDQPAFIISDVKEYQVRDGNRNRFQVKFQVENIEDVDGMIKVSFNYNRENQNIPGLNAEDQSSLSLVPKRQKKEIRFLLDEKPDRIVVNTLISKNIPSVISLSLGQFMLKENEKPVEGEVVLQAGTDTAVEEIIVDNEDEGFTTFSPISEPYLRKAIMERTNNRGNQKYHGEWRSSASQWRVTTGSGYYGKYIRSAHFTRSGSGEKIATWQPDLKESAYYDIYVHLTGSNRNFSNRGKQKSIIYKYQVFHDDGEDEITVDISKAERGWNFMGSFYFSKGAGKVTLSDQSENRSVFADAVKWVKQ